jgi:hypothetical protein
MFGGCARARHVSRIVLCVSALVILATGCGKKLPYESATVSGAVTIDGKPVAKGEVTFSPAAGGKGSVVGAEISAGRYRCEGVPVGKLRVSLVAQSAETQTIMDRSVDPPQPRQVPVDILPEKYQQGLDFEVAASGEVMHDFDLTSGP